MDEARAWGKLMRTMPSIQTHNTDYRRLHYVRYADDFLLGFNGPRSEVEEIKTRIATFLRDTLKLELATEKTLITHARTHAARFLGYDICIQQCDTKHTARRRSVNGRIGLRIPSEVLRKKRQKYMAKGKPARRPALLVESDFSIMERYHRELVGFADYYKMALNRSSLWRLYGTMRHSLTATLANKHKTTRSQIVQRYTGRIMTDQGLKEALVVTIPREDKSPLTAHFGAYSFQRNLTTPLVDALPACHLGGTTTLEQRLLADRCELCGSTEEVQVHHVRRLKDLKQKGRRDKPAWVKRMAQIRRKTLVVCAECHHRIHAGQPTCGEAAGG
jgi:hypothetical protein